MKQFTLLTTVLVLLLGSIACRSQVNKGDTAQSLDSPKLTVYYFHFTRRCATCLAVEENARKSVETLFPNEIKTGDYSFTSLNLDEPDSKLIADKLGVGGQTLLVVRGKKKVDITSAAWMSAHDPDKMKAEIKSATDKVLF